MLLRPSCFCAGISRLLSIFGRQPQAAEKVSHTLKEIHAI